MRIKKCPKCGNKDITEFNGGNIRCSKCGHRIKQESLSKSQGSLMENKQQGNKDLQQGGKNEQTK